MESINLQNVLDAGVYHPSTTEQNYGVYQKKMLCLCKLMNM
jgi:hypothetical protein